MANSHGQQYEQSLDDVSNQLAAARLSQRLSRDSGNLGSIHSIRSSRIEKPRSNRNSPQGVERRRTTSLARVQALNNRTPEVLPAYAYGVSTSQPYRTPQAARPVTWHPALFQTLQPNTHVSMEDAMSSSNMTPHYQVHQPSDLSTDPNTAHFDPFTQPNQFPYTDWQDFTSNEISSHAPNEATWNAYQILDGVQDNTIAPVPQSWWYMPDYTYPSQIASHELSSSQPSFSDSLPIQHPPDLVEDSTPQLEPKPTNTDEVEGEDKVLVGLGLYDPPATPPHPFASALSTGVGLKLEEAWAPAPDSEDDEDGEGEDDHEDNTANTYGLPTASQDVVTQMHKQAQLYKDAQWTLPQQGHDAIGAAVVQPSLEGQSFFFDHEDHIGSEWWCNPAANSRAQEQVFGHGWLDA